MYTAPAALVKTAQ